MKTNADLSVNLPIGSSVMFEDSISKKFIEVYPSFAWFITRWFGQTTLDTCIKLASEGNDSELGAILNEIWFALPSHIFNIIESPEGWSEFLFVIEE